MAKRMRITEGEEVAEGSQKMTPAVVPEAPEAEVFGHGVSDALTPKGYVAYRVSSQGRLEVLTPTRSGKVAGESKHSAVARMMGAITRAYIGSGR